MKDSLGKPRGARQSHATRLLGCSSMALAIIGASPSYAQTATSPPPSSDADASKSQATSSTDATVQADTGQAEAAASSPTGGLGDIVVTARKRSENLRNVPIAITAITGEQLQVKNITQILDLSSVTPNFQFSYGAVQPFTFIRGFGSGANASFEQSVAKFIDNVSFGRDADGRIPIFDVERLEVLKGPQVLAFGNSSTVGALNITTRKPGREFEADGSIGYEFNGEEAQLQGGVSVPLTGWASLRVAGLYQDLARGQVYNPLEDRREPTTRNWAIRPTLRLTPAPGLEVLLHYEYDHLRDNGSAIQAITQPLNPAVPHYVEVGDKDIRRANPPGVPFLSPDLGGLNGSLYQGDINYSVLGGTLTSTTAYRKMHSVIQFGITGPNDQTPYYNQLAERYNQFSEELRFTGTYGKLDVTAGGYIQRDTLHIDVISEFNLGAYGLTGAAATQFGRAAYYDQRTKTESAFTDLSYHLTDKFSVSAGLRYTHIAKTAGQTIYSTTIVPNLGFDTTRADLLAYNTPSLDPIVAAVAKSPVHSFPYGTLALTENHWQPQVIVQYKIDPRNQVYAKFVQGEKVGGFDFLYASATNPDGARFGSEKATSFELGTKGLIAGGTLEYAVAVFRTTFQDLQQSVLSNLVNRVSNVGKARSQGVEADLTYAPNNAIRLSLGGSYLDSRILNFPSAACNSVQNFATPSGCSQNLSDTPTQFASKFTGTFSADYRQPLAGGSYVLAFGGSVLARTKFNAGATNDPQQVQKGFAQIDAHIDLKPGQGWWQLSLFGRNLTNYKYLNYGVLATGSGTAVLGTYERGRQIGLRFSVKFR